MRRAAGSVLWKLAQRGGTPRRAGNPAIYHVDARPLRPTTLKVLVSQTPARCARDWAGAGQRGSGGEGLLTAEAMAHPRPAPSWAQPAFHKQRLPRLRQRHVVDCTARDRGDPGRWTGSRDVAPEIDAPDWPSLGARCFDFIDHQHADRGTDWSGRCTTSCGTLQLHDAAGYYPLVKALPPAPPKDRQDRCRRRFAGVRGSIASSMSADAAVTAITAICCRC